MRGTIMKYVAIVVMLLVCGEASAQQMKERGWVRKGNRQYNRQNFDGSIESYQRALQYDPTSFEAKYDLASALYRAKRFDKAEKTLMSIVNDSTRTELERGEVAYNLGNTQFAQQKFKEALSSYRMAMRCNPADEDAKFNYAFTKRMLQQQQQQQQQQENQDQNKENQDKQNNQDQQNGQNQQQEQPQDQQQKDGKDDPQNGEQHPEGAMNPEQQEALLQAIQAEEDKTQDKLKEKAGVLIRGGKNW